MCEHCSCHRVKEQRCCYCHKQAQPTRRIIKLEEPKVKQPEPSKEDDDDEYYY
jgi:hypothetical protein